jgi:hypothetical protein
MEDADRLFAGKQQAIPLVQDYRRAVESHWRSQQRVLLHAQALLDDGRTDLLLRPHPIEDGTFYTAWIESLPAELRSRVQIDLATDISSLILDCDLQISCETCTTAMESWVAKKPTIELIFDKHPMLYKETQAVSNYPCEDPTLLPEMVARHLAAPGQPEKHELRVRHLATWCANPDGQAARRVAQIAAAAVRAAHAADWSKLTPSDYRRATKLRGLRKLGLAYHFDPLLPFKRALFGKRYAAKASTYRKSIKPRDVAETRRRLSEVYSGA